MKIEVKNVSKKFKENIIIKDVSITFESGHIYGLFGRNGSGKSVFQKIICGLYTPTTGQVLFDGVDINAKNTFPPNLRAQIESPSFFPDLSGYKNLELLAEIQNKIGEKEILDALEVVNLTSEKDKRFSKYSLGMKQKLGVAQVIMEDPEVIVLDEPFNGIERKTVDKIIDFLLKKKEEGKLIIVSTHIMDDLVRLADIAFEFDDGKITEVKDAFKK